MKLEYCGTHLWKLPVHILFDRYLGCPLTCHLNKTPSFPHDSAPPEATRPVTLRRDILIDVFCFRVPLSSDLFHGFDITNASVKHLEYSPLSKSNRIIHNTVTEIRIFGHVSLCTRLSRVLADACFSGPNMLSVGSRSLDKKL